MILVSSSKGYKQIQSHSPRHFLSSTCSLPPSAFSTSCTPSSCPSFTSFLSSSVSPPGPAGFSSSQRMSLPALLTVLSLLFRGTGFLEALSPSSPVPYRSRSTLSTSNLSLVSTSAAARLAFRSSVVLVNLSNDGLWRQIGSSLLVDVGVQDRDDPRIVVVVPSNPRRVVEPSLQ
jgi:hypothetical protein